MSKTIKEIAEELGYSKTYISQTIKNNGLQSCLRKNGNKFVIDEYLEVSLKKHLSSKSQTKTANKTQNTVQETENNEISVSETVNHLRTQLVTKDQQIEQITKLLDQQQQLLLNEQSRNKELLEYVEKHSESTKWWQFWK